MAGAPGCNVVPAMTTGAPGCNVAPAMTTGAADMRCCGRIDVAPSTTRTDGDAAKLYCVPPTVTGAAPGTRVMPETTTEADGAGGVRKEETLSSPRTGGGRARLFAVSPLITGDGLGCIVVLGLIIGSSTDGTGAAPALTEVPASFGVSGCGGLLDWSAAEADACSGTLGAEVKTGCAAVISAGRLIAEAGVALES